MNELIHIHNQGPELRADSREVAKAFGIQHESLVKLITNHEPQLEQLGVFRFEIGKPPKGSEGKTLGEEACLAVIAERDALLLAIRKELYWNGDPQTNGSLARLAKLAYVDAAKGATEV